MTSSWERTFEITVEYAGRYIVVMFLLSVGLLEGFWLVYLGWLIH